MGARGDGGDVLEHAGLVVGSHDADEQRGRTQRIVEEGEIEPSVGLDGKDDGLKALASEVAHGFEDAGMLGRERHEAAPLVAGVQREADGALDGEVVRFGGAGGEDDFARVGAEQSGDFGAGRCNGLCREAPRLVGVAVRVAIGGREERPHRDEDARVAFGCRLVVEIDELAQPAFLALAISP